MRNLKRALSLGLTAAMISGLMVMGSSAASYADVTSEHNQEAIDVLEAVGIMIGDENGNFNPDQNVTRNEMAVVMANLMEYNVASYKDTSPFTDVPSWAEPYVAACYTNGITSGYSDTIYGGSDNVTTAQAALMLMKALGYFQYASDFGGDWQLATTRQGNAIDLFNGVDSGVTQPMTRNDVAQLVLNTLKSGTVTASTDGSWTIGDVTINNNVKYNYVTSNQDYAMSIDTVRSTDATTDAGRSIVELGEQLYMGDLQLESDDFDIFGRPARTWNYDGDEIGTYAKKELLKQTYTTGIEGGEVYNDIGAAAADYALTYSVDGVELSAADTEDESAKLERRNDEDMAATGDGVLTEVYVDVTHEQTYFAVINTYLAQAVNDYSTSNEYATLKVYDRMVGDTAATTSYNVEVDDVPNVADVTKDTFYQVNISYQNVDKGEIVILNDVEVLEDSSISKYSSDDGNETDGNAKVTKLTTGGTEYKANEKAFYDDEILYQYDEGLLTDNTYNVYLDQYGYFLGVDLYEGTKNYVFITGFDRNSSNLAVKTATANGIFLDGTMENIQVNVTATDDNIADLSKLDADERENAGLFIEWSTQGYSDLGDGLDPTDSAWAQAGKYGEEGIYNLNQWYTYTVNDAGVYTLKPAVRMTWTRYPYNTTEDTIIRTDNLSVRDNMGAGPKLGYVYGEDDTVFITVDLDEVDTTHSQLRAITDVNGVYTGVQDVELIVETEDNAACTEGQVYTVYDKNGYAIGAVVVGEALGDTGNYAYVLSKAKSEAREGDVYYWEFEAIWQGQKVTLTARDEYNKTIANLQPGDVVELRFDGDYVVSVKQATDMYKDYTFNNVSDYDLYFMFRSTDPRADGNNVPNVVSYDGRTMYVTSNKEDVGLGFTRDAKAVVIQDEYGEKDVVTEFDDVLSAVNYLVDPNTATSIKEYAGAIVAVLNSNGAAEWVVFDSDTPLVRDGQGGSVQQGNVATYYNSTVPLADGEKLSGSRATIESVDINTYGLMTATIDYIAPEWVAEGSLVTLNTDVLYYGADTTNDAVFTGVVGNNGRATLKFVSTTPFEYLPYTKGGISFGGITVPTDEVFSLINVYYFDQNNNRIDQNGVLDMSKTDSTLAVGTSELLNITMPNTALSTATAGVTIKGTNTDNTINPTYAQLKSGTWGPTRDADGDEPVVITIDLKNNLSAYSVTNNFAAGGVVLSNWNVTGTDANETLTLAISAPADLTSIGSGAELKGTLTLSDKNEAANYGYQVVCDKLGIDEVLINNTPANWSIRVTDNMTISANDFTVTPIAAFAPVSYVWKDYGTVEITFNRNVEATGLTIGASGQTINVTDAAGADLGGYHASANGKTVTITVDNGDFAAGDQIAITNGVKDDVYNSNTSAAKTITLSGIPSASSIAIP